LNWRKKKKKKVTEESWFSFGHGRNEIFVKRRGREMTFPFLSGKGTGFASPLPIYSWPGGKGEKKGGGANSPIIRVSKRERVSPPALQLTPRGKKKKKNKIAHPERAEKEEKKRVRLLPRSTQP